MVQELLHQPGFIRAAGDIACGFLEVDRPSSSGQAILGRAARTATGCRRERDPVAEGLSDRGEIKRALRWQASGEGGLRPQGVLGKHSELCDISVGKSQSKLSSGEYQFLSNWLRAVLVWRSESGGGCRDAACSLHNLLSEVQIRPSFSFVVNGEKFVVNYGHQSVVNLKYRMNVFVSMSSFRHFSVSRP